MSALKDAIRLAGGPGKAAEVCGITPRAVYKWLARNSLPRSDYTGETRYAHLLAAAADGKFSAEWLLEMASPNKAA